MLKKEAPCSWEMDRSVGIGGTFCRRKGLSFRYHFFLGSSLVSLDDDLELRAARVFSSATTTWSGSGVDMAPSCDVKEGRIGCYGDVGVGI